MSAWHTALVVAVVSLSAGCSQRSRESVDSAKPSTSASAMVSAPLPAPSAAKAPIAVPLDAEPPPSDIVYEKLRLAPIVSAKIVSWNRPGLLSVTLASGAGAEALGAFVSLAVDENPIGYRKPLAFERLATALGMRVVPHAVLRRVRTDELGALFAEARDLREYFSVHAAVQNDGTVDALVIAPSRGADASAFRAPKGRDVTLDSSLEAKRWARAVSEAGAGAGENQETLRDYVETLVLDYLSGNVLRRVVFFEEEAGAIHLTSNESAFPSKVDPRALDLLLARLRPVTRFPRGLREALMRLGREQAQKLFASGPFSEWLVSPRMLVDFEERRRSLLTLLDARVRELGEAAVLCL